MVKPIVPVDPDFVVTSPDPMARDPHIIGITVPISWTADVPIAIANFDVQPDRVGCGHGCTQAQEDRRK